MDSRHCRHICHLQQTGAFIKGAGDKKDEYDLDKFRRLKADAEYGIGQFGTVSDVPQKQHRQKGQSPDQRIQPAIVFQIFEPPHNIRDRHRHRHGHQHDHKLPDRQTHIQPRQRHKADHKQHTHIMKYQPVDSRITQLKQYQRRKYRQLLERIEKQILQFSRFNADCQKTGKMYKKQQDHLSGINALPALLLPKPEYRKTLVGIDCHT